MQFDLAAVDAVLDEFVRDAPSPGPPAPPSPEPRDPQRPQGLRAVVQRASPPTARPESATARPTRAGRAPSDRTPSPDHNVPPTPVPIPRGRLVVRKTKSQRLAEAAAAARGRAQSASAARDEALAAAAATVRRRSYSRSSDAPPGAPTTAAPSPASTSSSVSSDRVVAASDPAPAPPTPSPAVPSPGPAPGPRPSGGDEHGASQHTVHLSALSEDRPSPSLSSSSDLSALVLGGLPLGDAVERATADDVRRAAEALRAHTEAQRRQCDTSVEDADDGRGAEADPSPAAALPTADAATGASPPRDAVRNGAAGRVLLHQARQRVAQEQRRGGERRELEQRVVRLEHSLTRRSPSASGDMPLDTPHAVDPARVEQESRPAEEAAVDGLLALEDVVLGAVRCLPPFAAVALFTDPSDADAATFEDLPFDCVVALRDTPCAQTARPVALRCAQGSYYRSAGTGAAVLVLTASAHDVVAALARALAAVGDGAGLAAWFDRGSGASFRPVLRLLADHALAPRALRYYGQLTDKHPLAAALPPAGALHPTVLHGLCVTGRCDPVAGRRCCALLLRPYVPRCMAWQAHCGLRVVLFHGVVADALRCPRRLGLSDVGAVAAPGAGAAGAVEDPSLGDRETGVVSVLQYGLQRGLRVVLTNAFDGARDPRASDAMMDRLAGWQYELPRVLVLCHAVPEAFAAVEPGFAPVASIDVALDGL